jgi:hypothetical protein
MFQNGTSPIRPNMQGMLAQQVMRTPQGRRLYREQFGILFSNIFKVELLTNRVDSIVSHLMPSLVSYDKGFANEFRNQANGVKDRIRERAVEIGKQLAFPEPKPLQFVDRTARLRDWIGANQPNIAKLDRSNFESVTTLHIKTAADSSGSWRSKVLLEGGHYRFEGRARSSGIVPLKDDQKGQGAGLRISGSQQARSNKLLGDAEWTRIEYEFDATNPNDEVDLVCELRAQKGEVWFDVDSLKLVRLK